MDFNNYLEELIEKRLIRVQQGMPCEIVSFDKVNMRADVKPYLQDDSQEAMKSLRDAGKPIAPQDFPILPGLPVGLIFSGGAYIRPVYDEGDLVWVTFATHDIDEPMKQNRRPVSKKAFDMENASVVCGLVPTRGTIPTEFSDSGLLIGHKDGTAYLRFESSKVTAIFGTKKVEWSNGGMRFFDGALWTNFMTHTHAGAGLPPTPGT